MGEFDDNFHHLQLPEIAVKKHVLTIHYAKVGLRSWDVFVEIHPEISHGTSDSKNLFNGVKR